MSLSVPDATTTSCSKHYSFDSSSFKCIYSEVMATGEVTSRESKGSISCKAFCTAQQGQTNGRDAEPEWSRHIGTISYVCVTYTSANQFSL